MTRPRGGDTRHYADVLRPSPQSWPRRDHFFPTRQLLPSGRTADPPAGTRIEPVFGLGVLYRTVFWIVVVTASMLRETDTGRTRVRRWSGHGRAC